MARKSISVHVTEAEKQIFQEAMEEDDMVDLGPWIAKVVRGYIKDKDSSKRLLEEIRDIVGSAEGKADSADHGIGGVRRLTEEILVRVATSPDDSEQIEKILHPHRKR